MSDPWQVIRDAARAHQSQATEVAPLAPKPSKPSMHAFIDDSGCSGFKFDTGSSAFTIMSAAIFRDSPDIEQLAKISEACRAHNKVRTEWKYSGVHETARDCFFRCTAPVPYAVRTLVVDKRQLWHEKLLEGKPLKAWMIRQLLTHTFGTVQNAKVIVDGKDTRGFGIEDQQYLVDKVNRETPGVVHSVKFDDSKLNVGVQLADMTAGAVARAHEPKKRKSDKHLRVLRPRMARSAGGSLWRFQDR